MKKVFLILSFILSSFSINAQTITSVTPNEGVVGEEMKVIITGNNNGTDWGGYFRTASTVNDFSFTNQFGNFLAIQSVKILDYFQNQIEILFTIPIDAILGDYDIKIFETEPFKPTTLKNTVLNGFKVLGDIVTNLTSTYQDFNNDGFTSVGDVINLDYSLKNNTNVDITNVNIVSNNPYLSVTGQPISVLNSGSTDATTFKGKKVITQEEINQGFVNLNSIVTGVRGTSNINYNINRKYTLSISDGIKLNAFYDNNANNVQDQGEANLEEANFSIQLNSGSIKNVYSSSGVHYFYETNSSNSYNLSYIIPAKYASKYTVTTPTYNAVKVINGSGITIINFAVKLTTYDDLSVQLYSQSAPPRPGFMYNNIIQYTNKGNQTVASGILTFTKNNVASLSSVSQSGTFATTGGGFTYNFTNLLPNETRTITVSMLVPVIPIVELGQLLTNSVSISSSATDVDITNNDSSLTQIIVGSYDPNDKTESHGERIIHSSFTTNDYLFYTIRFENTGTAEAINIRITDELDAKLDENTVESIETDSKNYVLERTGKNLTWRFDGINLPPSTPSSSTIGHGSVRFKVKPKAGYKVGDIINNTANIFFDFNPAIITNICKTEFINTLSTDDNVLNDLTVYPNPTSNLLIINSKSTLENVEILSSIGQKIISQKVNDTQTEVSLKELSNGYYFVKISANGSEKVVKIIKE